MLRLQFERSAKINQAAPSLPQLFLHLLVVGLLLQLLLQLLRIRQEHGEEQTRKREMRVETGGARTLMQIF